MTGLQAAIKEARHAHYSRFELTTPGYLAFDDLEAFDGPAAAAVVAWLSARTSCGARPRAPQRRAKRTVRMVTPTTRLTPAAPAGRAGARAGPVSAQPLATAVLR